MAASVITDMSEDLGDMEDSVIPPYLSKTKAYTIEKQKRAMEALVSRDRRRRCSVGSLPRSLSSLKSASSLRGPPPVRGFTRMTTSLTSLPDSLSELGEDGVMTLLKKWKVQDVDYNAWRKNIIDTRTIYGARESTLLAESELPQPELPTRPTEHDGRADHHQVVENGYIRQTLPTNQYARDINERRRFSRNILHEYKKPVRSQSPSYGAPSSEFIGKTKKKLSFFEVVKQRMQAEQGFKIFAENEKISQCERPNPISCQFCDVLGPNACHRCIETTNRRIARDIENSKFPEVDCTATTLVAPKLSKVMREGEILKAKVTGASSDAEAGILLTDALPKVQKLSVRFGRAGVERQWEASAIQYTDEQLSLPPLKPKYFPLLGSMRKKKKPLTDRQKRSCHLWQKVKNAFVES